MVEEGVQQLIEAAEAGELREVQKLLDKGVGINAGMLGVTPLMVAAANGHASICALLLSNGANVNAHDEDGLSALDWASDVVGENGDAVRKALVDSGGELGPGEEEDAFDNEDFAGGEADTRGMAGANAGEFFRADTKPAVDAMERLPDGRLKFGEHDLEFDPNADRKRQHALAVGMTNMLEAQVRQSGERMRAEREADEAHAAELAATSADKARSKGNDRTP